MVNQRNTSGPRVGFYNPRAIPLNWMGGGPRKLLCDFYRWSRSRFWWGVNFSTTLKTGKHKVSLLNLLFKGLAYYPGLPILNLRERYRFRESSVQEKAIFVFSDSAALAMSGHAGKLIVGFHGVGPEFQQQRETRPPDLKPYAAIALLPRVPIYWASILVADKVAFPSKGAVADFRRLLPNYLKEIFDRKLIVLPNGIRKPSISDDLDGPFPWNWSKTIIVPARLVHSKGQDLLLDAIIDLKANGKLVKDDTEFLFIGQGPKKRDLAFSAKALENRIHFIPFMEHETLMQGLDRCRGVAITHRKTVFDLVLLEAMALGKPILTTDIPGNQEMFEQESALLANPNVDSIAIQLQRLLYNKNLRIRLGQSAKRRWRKYYTHEAMADRYEQTGHMLIGEM